MLLLDNIYIIYHIYGTLICCWVRPNAQTACLYSHFDGMAKYNSSWLLRRNTSGMFGVCILFQPWKCLLCFLWSANPPDILKREILQVYYRFNPHARRTMSSLSPRRLIGYKSLVTIPQWNHSWSNGLLRRDKATQGFSARLCVIRPVDSFNVWWCKPWWSSQVFSWYGSIHLQGKIVDTTWNITTTSPFNG